MHSFNLQHYPSLIITVSNNDNKTCENALPISTVTKNFDFSSQSCEQEESFGENDEMIHDMRTRMNDGELSTQHLYMTNLQNGPLFLYKWEYELTNSRKIYDNIRQFSLCKFFGCESSPISRNLRSSVRQLDKCKVRPIKAK